MEYESIIDDIKKHVVDDLKEAMDNNRGVGIYRFMFASNPKPYPISGLQHFLGTAFLSLRLAYYFGAHEESELIIAFLGGLLHDFEKMGLTRNQMLKDGMRKVIGEETRLYSIISQLFWEKMDYIWRSAIELAFKLEGGGVTNPRLQRLVPFIRVADYITGGAESWNIMNVFDLLVREAGIPPENIVPVVLGRQRPLVSMISEKLEEYLESMELIPLVTTPTGSIFLATKDIKEKLKKELPEIYQRLAEELLKQPEKSERKDKEKTRRMKGLSHKSIVNFLENARKGGKINVGNLLSRIKTLRQLDIGIIEATIRDSITPVDMKYAILHLALIYAKTLGEKRKKKATEVVPEVFRDLGIKVSKTRFEEILVEADSILSSMSPDELKGILSSLNNKIRDYIKHLATTTGTEVLSEYLKRILNIGGEYLGEQRISKERLKVCAVCRESFPAELATPLKEYIQSLKKIFSNLNYSDVFHTDVQASPDKPGSLEGLATKLHVCPICNYESVTFPKKVGLIDGMWSSVLVYYPAISTDFLHVIKNAIEREKRSKEAEIVIPDYITSKIIVKTSDERGRLRKSDLLRALDLWYYYGGNLVLTTHALSTAFVWNGQPIEIEKTDTIIEESVRAYMLELKLAKERGEWSRTRNLRRTLYKQLQTYVGTLDEPKGVREKPKDVKFRRTWSLETLHPALDIYSSFVTSLMNRSNLKRLK